MLYMQTSICHQVPWPCTDTDARFSICVYAGAKVFSCNASYHELKCSHSAITQPVRCLKQSTTCRCLYSVTYPALAVVGTGVETLLSPTEATMVDELNAELRETLSDFR